MADPIITPAPWPVAPAPHYLAWTPPARFQTTPEPGQAAVPAALPAPVVPLERLYRRAA